MEIRIIISFNPAVCGTGVLVFLDKTLKCYFLPVVINRDCPHILS